MEMRPLETVIEQQAGVVARRQLREGGLSDTDIARRVRRRELVRVHPRVYVDRTGPLTWTERAWAAVLWAEPAALCHESAWLLGERGTRPARATIHVAVAWPRHLPALAGVEVHRRRDFDSVVDQRLPPRVRSEDTVLDLVEGEADELGVVARLADACSRRHVSAAGLRDCARARPRLRRRRLVEAWLADIEAGTCSALEAAYLDRVVRPHRLPEGRRQASHRHAGDLRFRDVLLPDHETIVELDGRAFHDSTRARDVDMERDLDAAADEGLLTVRLGWGQAVQRPCRTAARLHTILGRRGPMPALAPCPNCATTSGSLSFTR